MTQRWRSGRRKQASAALSQASRRRHGFGSVDLERGGFLGRASETEPSPAHPRPRSYVRVSARDVACGTFNPRFGVPCNSGQFPNDRRSPYARLVIGAALSGWSTIQSPLPLLPFASQSVAGGAPLFVTSTLNKLCGKPSIRLLVCQAPPDDPCPPRSYSVGFSQPPNKPT